MVNHTLKTLGCEHRKIFKVYTFFNIMHEYLKATSKHIYPSIQYIIHFP